VFHVIVLKPVDKRIIVKQVSVDYGNLIGELQVPVAFAVPVYLLCHEQAVKIELYAQYFEGVGVEGHFYVGQFPAVKGAGEVKADLAVARGTGWGFVGGDGEAGDFPADEGGEKALQRPA
jgi:hypothetical protein